VCNDGALNTKILATPTSIQRRLLIRSTKIVRAARVADLRDALPMLKIDHQGHGTTSPEFECACSLWITSPKSERSKKAFERHRFQGSCSCQFTCFQYRSGSSLSDSPLARFRRVARYSLDDGGKQGAAEVIGRKIADGILAFC
jgi:hypothetical protein